MKFEPQGVSSSNTLEIKIPNSQLNYYRAGGLLKYKHYRVSVSTYNLNGLGTSNKSAVAWAWTQEDGKNPYAYQRALSRPLLRVPETDDTESALKHE